MHTRILTLLCIVALIGGSIYRTSAQSLSLRGQLSNWFVLNDAETNNYQLGVRYIPTVFLQKDVARSLALDLECSLKSYMTVRKKTPGDDGIREDINPYRLTLRLSSAQFEARLGLQKMSFGSATVFRPLMWFDTIDPRDPLQITDGVYGLLLRYYFLNNANLWLWGLYGNDDAKGWEFFGTKKKAPEFGGRFQLPCYTGEIAVTYHYRKFELEYFSPTSMTSAVADVPEHRFAFDGKWDVGIGVWLEGFLQHQDSELLPHPWRRAYNIGMDYTFALGNGLNVLGEYFSFESAPAAFDAGERSSFSAVSLNYPLGLMDACSAIIYYDADNEFWYRFIRWQRTYDRWTIHLFGFWNPDEYTLYQDAGETTQYTGRGFQVMIVFNH